MLKNISLVKDGKKEALEEGLIYTLSWYLDSKIEKERLYSSSFMMSIANILDAKKQISEYTFNMRYEILEVKLYKKIFFFFILFLFINKCIEFVFLL